jgi:hypothetical protein
MILGMSTAAFTEFHVLLSLIGIVSGIIVVFGMLKSNLMPAMTSIFLLTTVATSVTGFMFDSPFGPARVVGIISLGVLAVAIAALYGFKLAGRWRVAYVASAVLALYLNCFVGVVQTFLKIPFFHALAPTQKEPPFGIAQALVFIVLLAFGIAAARKFHPSAPARAMT